MDRLALRKVQHPQAHNNYRVILQTDHNGDVEIGSIGVKAFTSTDTAWCWGIDTVLPMRDHESEGRGNDRKKLHGEVPRGMERHCAQTGWLDEFLSMKRQARR
jgi:hypothetical protein